MLVKRLTIFLVLLTGFASARVFAAGLAEAGEDPNDVWLTEENWRDGMDPFRTSATKKATKPAAAETAAQAAPVQDTEVEPHDAPIPPLPAEYSPLTASDHGRPPETRGKLTLSPFYDYSEIKATDKATGERYTLTSGTGFGGRIQWTQGQTESFNSRITAGVQTQKFDGPPTIRLAEHSPTLWTLGVGGEYLLNEWLSFDADIFARHEVFARRVSASDISLDRLVIPQARLGARVNVHRSQDISAALAAEVDYYYQRSPTNAPSQVRHGLGYGGAVLLQKDLGENFALGITGAYLKRLQDTLVTSQDEQNYRAAIDFILRM